MALVADLDNDAIGAGRQRRTDAAVAACRPSYDGHRLGLASHQIDRVASPADHSAVHADDLLSAPADHNSFHRLAYAHREPARSELANQDGAEEV